MADTQSAPEINNDIKEVEKAEEIKQDTPIEGTDKKKKQLSEIQIQHLNAIRVKALERKREIKLQKHKQYEEECKLKRINNIKQVPLEQPKEELIKETIKEEPTVPKKKKTVKKIIKYVEESDDDDAEEIEEVIVKKNTKPKQQQQQQQQQVKQENQYTDLLYHSSLDRLRERMLNERAKTLVSNVMPCYF